MPNGSQEKSKANWPGIGCLVMILAGCALWQFLPMLIGMGIALLPEPQRAYRQNQHELLRDGRSVDLIFKGHDASDGSFLVQTSRQKSLVSIPLKSRALALAAEPDLRILPSGKAVLFVKSGSGQQSLPMGLDEFLEGVENAPDYK